jgi:hypothetical protein
LGGGYGDPRLLRSPDGPRQDRQRARGG